MGFLKVADFVHAAGDNAKNKENKLSLLLPGIGMPTLNSRKTKPHHVLEVTNIIARQDPPQNAGAEPRERQRRERGKSDGF